MNNSGQPASTVTRLTREQTRAGKGRLTGRAPTAASRATSQTAAEAMLDAPPVIGPGNSEHQFITPKEAEEIAALRAALDPEAQAALASAPEDIQHDLMLCRFLRGHGAKALQALQSHLRYRREHAAVLARIRRRLPPDMQDFDATLAVQAAVMQDHFGMLQLPAKLGTNEGMQVSLISLGHMKLDGFFATPEQQVLEWFISSCEMRSICLHNQSLREGRIATVTEVRDCHGFNWGTVLSSALALRRFMVFVKVAQQYPEVIGKIMLFNLEPSGGFLSLMRRMIPKETEQKMIWARRGDWQSVACTPGGLSCAALVEWSNHVDAQDSGWHCLTPDRPQAVRAMHAKAGDELSWRAACRQQGGRAAAVLVKAHFFSAAQPIPLLARCCEPRRLLGKTSDSTSSGEYRAPADGVVLLEVVLEQGRGRDRVFAQLALAPKGCNGLPVITPMDSLSPPASSPHEKSVAKAASPPGLVRELAQENRFPLVLLLLWWVMILLFWPETGLAEHFGDSSPRR